MKKYILKTFAVAAALMLSGNTWAIDQDGDGNYIIATAQDLVDFANLYNDQPNNGKIPGASAIFTADIDMAGVAFPGIGNDSHENRRFHGTLDGQGHKISNLVMEGDCVALIRVASDNAVIKNLVIDSSCEFKGTGRNAAFISASNWPEWGSNTIRFENCGNEANVTAKGNNAGGMIGVNMNGSASFIFNDCYNTGAIKGGESGALSGWSGGGWSVFNSCWNAGLAGEGGDDFTRNNGTQLRNCYSVEGTTNATQAAMVAEGTLASGELAYKLGAAWRQTIGEDATPVLDATHGIVGLITAAGYATQYIASADVEITTGVKAYTATVENETLVLNELSDAIAAQEAVIVQGAEGYYSFVPTTGAEKAQKNGLVGVEADTEAIEGTYVLQSQNEKVGFYQVGEVKPTVKAGHAYLATESEVKAFLLEDAVTAISKLASEGQKAQIFDINGRQTGKLQKGINIVNGVKVLVK